MLDHYSILQGKLNVQIRRKPGYDCYEWLLFYYNKDSLGVAQPMEFRFVEQSKGSMIEPTFEVTGPMMRDFCLGLLRAIKEIGFELEPDARLQGEVKALKDHLHDMRVLVFKGDKERYVLEKI